MKSILTVISLFICVLSFSQSTSPRFGTASNTDQTGRMLTYKYFTVTDTASAKKDTINIKPAAWQTIYRMVLVDSASFGLSSLASSYAGDNLTFVFSAASGTPWVNFIGTNFVTAGIVTMTTRLRSVVKFIFDGAKWVETGRYTQ